MPRRLHRPRRRAADRARGRRGPSRAAASTPRLRGELIEALAERGDRGGQRRASTGRRAARGSRPRPRSASSPPHADVIGMTVASECVVAGELGLRYAALCVVDNLANGVGGRRAHPGRDRRATATRTGPRSRRPSAALPPGIAPARPPLAQVAASRGLTRCRRSATSAPSDQVSTSATARVAKRRREDPARRVSAGSITSSSSNRVAALSAFACSWAWATICLEALGALGLVGDRLELAAKAELDRALEPHRAELGRRPADREQRLVQAAAGHRLGAEPVGLAQDHGAERHAQRGAGDEQARAVAHQRRSPRRRARPSSPGVSISETIGIPKASQSCMKRAALSAPSLVIAPGEAHRVVGDHPERRGPRSARAR